MLLGVLTTKYALASPHGKQSDRFETLSQCTEWSQFALWHLCSTIWTKIKIQLTAVVASWQGWR